MVANVVRNTIAVWGSYRASKKMHARLLSHVLLLPMAFFDSQPLGRLLNRFTKDTEAVDVELLKLVSHHLAEISCTVAKAASVSWPLESILLITVRVLRAVHANDMGATAEAMLLNVFKNLLSCILIYSTINADACFRSCI